MSDPCRADRRPAARAGPPVRAVDMSTRLGGVADPQPGAHRLRLRGGRPRAGAVRRPRRARRGRHQVGACSRRARAGRPRGWPRRRAGCSTRSACRARASRRSSPTTCPGSPSAGRARSCPSPGLASRSSPSSPPGSAGPTAWLVEVNISCPNVEDRGQVFACDPRGLGRRRHRRAARHRPGASRCSPSSRPDVTDIVAVARACVGRRRRRAVADQHPARHGDRHRHAAAGAGRGHRRAVRAGHPAGRRALRLAGPRRRCPDVPILGMGGIRTGLDALQFVLAGASAVSVGTAVFGDPPAPARVLRRARGGARRARLRPAADAVGRRAPARRHAHPCRRGRTRSADHAAPRPRRAPADVERAPRDRARPRSGRGADRRRPRRRGPRHGGPLGGGGDAVREHGQGRPGAVPALRPGRRRAVRGGSGAALFLDLKLHDIPATPWPAPPARSPGCARASSPCTPPAARPWSGPPSRRRPTRRRSPPSPC